MKSLWDFSDFKDFLLKYTSFDIQQFNIRNVSPWLKQQRRMITFAPNPIHEIYEPWLTDPNIKIIKIETNSSLRAIDIQTLFKKIFKFKVSLDESKICWQIIQNRKVADLPNIVNNFANLFSNIELSVINNLTTICFNYLLFFSLNGVLPELDYSIIQYFDDFFQREFSFQINNPDEVYNLINGYNVLLSEEKSFETKFISKYILQDYKLAKFEYLSKGNQQFLILSPTYLWYFIKDLYDKRRFTWINEILWISKRKFNKKDSNDTEITGEHNNDVYFWVKCFIFSPGYEKRSREDIYSWYKALIRPLLKLNLRDPKSSQMEINNDIFNSYIDFLQELLKTQDLIQQIPSIPKFIYKPNFLSNIFTLREFKDDNLLNNFTEFFCFNIFIPRNIEELEEFIQFIHKEEKLDLLLKILLVFRYYLLLIENDNLDVEQLQQNLRISDYVFCLYRIIFYRIWKLTPFPGDFFAYWELEYKKVENPEIFFQVFNRILVENLGYTNYDSMCDILGNFIIPAKSITEFILNHDGILSRDQLISQLPQQNTLFIVLDGLSYFSSNNLNLIDGVKILPARITDLTDTKTQVQKIWQNLNRFKTNLCVCSDQKMPEDLLFNLIPGIQAYIVSNGYKSLQRTPFSSFFNENNFYFMYISCQEGNNLLFDNFETYTEKYRQFLLNLMNDLRTIQTNSSIKVFITSDHGSTLVKENTFYRSLLEASFSYSKNKTHRTIIPVNLKPEDEVKLKSKLFLLIQDQNNYSLLPNLILNGSSKIVHTGISLEENLVPWIHFTIKEK